MEYIKTWEATTSGRGSPSAAGRGDNTLAILLVFFIIFMQMACGSTIPLIVTSFCPIFITTPSTPVDSISFQLTLILSLLNNSVSYSTNQ